MILNFKTYIKNLSIYLIDKFFIIFYGKINLVHLTEVQFEEEKVFEEDFFVMSEFKDLFGNSNKNFLGYEATIPSLKVRQLSNSFCITNKEEIYNSQKNVISEFTSQKKNPMFGRSKYIFSKYNLLEINASVAHLSLSGLENNYYHFLTECMSRYFLIEKSKFKPDYYIISNHLHFQKELLNLLGIEDERIIPTNKNLLIYANKLIVPDFINNWEIKYFRGDLSFQKIWGPTWLSKCYKDAFPSILSARSKKRYIYISRQKALYRKLINHKEVEDLLNEFGFKTYFLEQMNVYDQIKLFSSATHVFGIHGAGFANLYFAAEGVNFFELYPEFYHDSSFRILATTHKINYSYIISNSYQLKDKIAKKDDVFVDIKGLKIALTNFIK